MDYLILALATWRISSMLTDELGPWGLLIKFRHLVGVRFDEHSEPYGTNVIAEAFTCVWCLSIYVGTFIYVLWRMFPDMVLAVSIPLSLSTVAIIVDGLVGDKSDDRSYRVE